MNTRSCVSRVTGWATALPSEIVTNYDLEKTLDTSHDWIVERTGIHSRHVGGSTHDLSVESGKTAIASAGLTAHDINMVVLATARRLPLFHWRSAKPRRKAVCSPASSS